MPSRTQSMIRRDINRLRDTVERRKGESKALAAIQPAVASAAESVNKSWQQYQAAAVAGDKERAERETAVENLIEWVQRWRPVVLLLIPGAEDNIRQLPPSGATPDDLIRVAEDMVEFINSNPAAESFRSEAMETLGDKIEVAHKETAEAAAALPEEAAARQSYGEACTSANPILIRGSEIVRAIFGRTSPEYKQFIERSSPEEENELDQDAQAGEGEQVAETEEEDE